MFAFTTLGTFRAKTSMVREHFHGRYEANIYGGNHCFFLLCSGAGIVKIFCVMSRCHFTIERPRNCQHPRGLRVDGSLWLSTSPPPLDSRARIDAQVFLLCFSEFFFFVRARKSSNSRRVRRRNSCIVVVL